MSLTPMFLLMITTLIMMSSARTLNSPDQLMPLIFSSVNPDGNGFMSASNTQARLIVVIEQIIKYVSSIKSPETFIDNIINRHKDVSEKMKVLTFLNKCFEITRDVIQQEIDTILGRSSPMKKSSSSSSTFTLEELQQVQSKINDLLTIIEKRMATLKTWIPPTMPFLGFF